MKVIEVDPRTDQLWAALVAETDSDVFHSPAWLRVLGESYGFDIRARVALADDGEPVGGLSYCLVDGIRGPRISSLPFSDYCDPLVSRNDVWDLLVEPLLEEGIPLTLRALHNDIPASDGRLTVTGGAKWHGIELIEGLEDIWAGISSSARRAVRKAESAGIEIREASDKRDLRSFFELHLRVRKYRHHLLAQPYRFFENIYDEFIARGEGILLLATVHGDVVGGVLYLQWKDKLYYKFNAWDSEHTTGRPNDAVMWEGISRAKESDLRLIDLGLSDSDQEGLLRYKRKYSHREGDIVFLSSAGSAGHALSASMALIPQIVDLLTGHDVPDEVTERGGDILYSLFA